MSDALERYRWLVVALLAVPLLSGIFLLVLERVNNDSDPVLVRDSNGSPAPTDGTALSDIRVDISGGVTNPGVYALPEGSRWIDALEAAGGATDDANLEAINLATRARDEDKIIVPVFAGPVAAGASSTPNPLTNINSASESQLRELPGIGEVRAAAIIRSRDSDGPFTDIEDLLTRDLIPESVFEDIAGLITIGP